MPTLPFDPMRAAELYRRYAGRLHLRLCRKFRDLDPQAVADAVVEAVLALALSSEPDTERRVVYKALGRLRTARRSEARRRAREATPRSGATKSATATPSMLEELADREAESADHELARRYRDRIARTEVERTALDLWLNGCKSPNDLAGRMNSSVAEANTLLTRFRKRIQREREGVRPEGA
jgi:hypothetical protein